MLKSGRTSTEWWGIVSVIAMGAGKMLGLFPEGATVSSITTETTEALPQLVDGVLNLAGQNSGLLIAGALVWAYLKRRSSLKAKALGKEIPNEP